MITLHLLRHGETVWHAENRYAGSSDVALTDRGRQQARDLAPWAAHAGLDLVASSDLSRARLTAAPVAAATGVPHVVDARLREVDFGRGEGMTRTEMSALFPDSLAGFLAAPATSPLPAAESGEAACERAIAALVELLADEQVEVLAVVAHSSLLRLLLCRLLGLPLDGYRDRFPVLSNASLTTLGVPRVMSAADLHGRGSLLRYNSDVPTDGAGARGGPAG